MGFGYAGGGGGGGSGGAGWEYAVSLQQQTCIIRTEWDWWRHDRQRKAWQLVLLSCVSLLSSPFLWGSHFTPYWFALSWMANVNSLQLQLHLKHQLCSFTDYSPARCLFICLPRGRILLGWQDGLEACKLVSKMSNLVLNLIPAINRAVCSLLEIF